MEEYKPKKWYQSELYWLIISVVIVLILIPISFITPLSPYWFLPSFAYIGYFVLKGIIYAWFINPKDWYTKQFNKIRNFFSRK